MNDADAVRTRFTKYLLPVIISSVAFNIPKFFESEVVYVPRKVSRKQHTRGRMSADISRRHFCVVHVSLGNANFILVLLYYHDYKRLL